MGACEGDHLGMAEWLFEVGGAEDIRTKSSGGWTPVMAACNHLDVYQWLLLESAANDNGFYVDDEH